MIKHKIQNITIEKKMLSNSYDCFELKSNTKSYQFY